MFIIVAYGLMSYVHRTEVSLVKQLRKPNYVIVILFTSEPANNKIISNKYAFSANKYIDFLTNERHNILPFTIDGQNALSLFRNQIILTIISEYVSH